MTGSGIGTSGGADTTLARRIVDIRGTPGSGRYQGQVAARRRGLLGATAQHFRQQRQPLVTKGTNRAGAAKVAHHLGLKLQHVARQRPFNTCSTMLVACQIGKRGVILAPDHSLLASSIAPDDNTNHHESRKSVPTPTKLTLYVNNALNT